VDKLERVRRANGSQRKPGNENVFCKGTEGNPSNESRKGGKNTYLPDQELVDF
jgi:hypothetical protein